MIHHIYYIPFHFIGPDGCFSFFCMGNRTGYELIPSKPGDKVEGWRKADPHSVGHKVKVDTFYPSDYFRAVITFKCMVCGTVYDVIIYNEGGENRWKRKFWK